MCMLASGKHSWQHVGNELCAFGRMSADTFDSIT